MEKFKKMGAEELPNKYKDIIAKSNEFLKLFYGAEKPHLIRIHPTKQGTSYLTPNKVKHWNNKGYNIYLSVNPVKDGVNKKPSKSDIKSVMYAHLDLDPVVDKKYSSELRTKILKFAKEIDCTFAIDSGNGVGLFFRLDDGVNFEDVEAINRGLIVKYKEYGADTGTHNVDRIMRLPYTLNYPNASKILKGYSPEPVAATLIKATGEVFNSSEFEKVYSAEKKELTSTPSSSITDEQENEALGNVEIIKTTGENKNSKREFAFTKDYIHQCRVFDPTFVPTWQTLREAMLAVGLDNLRDKEPEKLGVDKRGKDYIKRTIENALQSLENENNQLYRLPSGKYLIVNNGELINDGITAQAITGFAFKFNLAKVVKNKIVLAYTEHINDVRIEINYFADKEYSTKLEGLTLVVTHNPAKGWNNNPILNQDIIDDYSNKVLNGKLEDIIKLMFLSLKFREDKLIRLLIFGGSNKGKTKLASLLGAVVLKFKDFHVAINPDNSRQFAVSTYNEINQSGVLCIDETNEFIPNAVKDMELITKVQVIGQGSGNPMNTSFIFLTSTHNEILEPLNDEWENRLMSIDIGDDGYNVKTSPIAKKYHREYERQCELYIQKSAREVLEGDYTIEDLEELQEKCKFNSSTNARGELIEAVKELVSKGVLRELGETIIVRDGRYYIKRKVELKNYINNILEIEASGSYIDNRGNARSKLYSHFISEDRVSLKFSGHRDPVSYYELLNVATENDDLDNF